MHRSKIAFLGVIDIELFPLFFWLSYAVSRVPEVEGIFGGSLALQEYCVGFLFSCAQTPFAMVLRSGCRR